MSLPLYPYSHTIVGCTWSSSCSDVPGAIYASRACLLKSQGLAVLHRVFVEGKAPREHIAQTQMWVILCNKKNFAFPGEQDKQSV